MSQNRSFSNANRLPKKYVKAARYLSAVKQQKQSLNNLIYSDKNAHVDIKSIYALVNKALQHSEELDKMHKILLSQAKDATHVDEFKVKILLTELFWGKQTLPTTANNNNINSIRECLDLLSKVPSTSDDFNLQLYLPKFARINTLSTCKEEVLYHLEQDGWEKVETPTTYSRFLKRCAKLSEPNFMEDFHYDDILVFPNKTPLYKHCLYDNGSLVLQAKSSCIPIKVLDPKPGDVVMDMCAAPGMKTTQIGAHLQNEGVIYAIEKDTKRHALLEEMLANYGVTCAKTSNTDLMTLKPDDYADVTHILLDPSCSNSGMGKSEVEKKSEEQIRKLASFQTLALVHALSFPKVQRIVYSTCSINPLENEAVIDDAMKKAGDGFEVVEKVPSSDDFTRGSEEYKFGKHGVYFQRDKDQTTGFFVCVMERK